MDITLVTPITTTAKKVVILFCLVWPFLAMYSVPRRGRSSAPLNAAIVALAVVVCGAWLDLADIARTLDLSGGAIDVLNAIFATTSIAIWPIAWIAVLTLILRHRPQIDQFVVALAILLAIQVIAMFLFVQVLAPSKSLIVFARTAAAMTVVTAMTAALRLFFGTARQ